MDCWKNGWIFKTLHHLIPDRNVYMCDTYGFSWVLHQDFILRFQHLLFFYSREAKVSDIHAFISHLHPWQQRGGEGDSANRVGDIRLHFQGVEGIELPQFPHLRRTEARNQCNQCCLSEPLIHTVRHASFRSPLYSHLYTLQRSCSIFFYTWPHFPPFLSRSLCFPRVNRDVITGGAWCSAPRASRITCCLPAITSLLIFHPACERRAVWSLIMSFQIMRLWS